jgi:hypothetical protein
MCVPSPAQPVLIKQQVHGWHPPHFAHALRTVPITGSHTHPAVHAGIVRNLQQLLMLQRAIQGPQPYRENEKDKCHVDCHLVADPQHAVRPNTPPFTAQNAPRPLPLCAATSQSVLHAAALHPATRTPLPPPRACTCGHRSMWGHVATLACALHIRCMRRALVGLAAGTCHIHAQAGRTQWAHTCPRSAR